MQGLHAIIMPKSLIQREKYCCKSDILLLANILLKEASVALLKKMHNLR